MPLSALFLMKQKLPISKESVEVSVAPLSFSNSDTGSSSGEPYIASLLQDDMVFEAATPVTPGIRDDQPLGAQDEVKGSAGNIPEAQPKKPAFEDINVDALGINWDRNLLRSISEATVPPLLEDKLKETSFDDIFNESKKNLTKVKFLICFEHSTFLLCIFF